jgi:transcriptional regulator with XRE-family HTH domain
MEDFELGAVLKRIRIDAGFSTLESMERKYKNDATAPFHDNSTLSRWENGKTNPPMAALRWYVKEFPQYSLDLRKHVSIESFSNGHFTLRYTIQPKLDGTAELRDESYHDVSPDGPIYQAVCSTEAAQEHVRNTLIGLYTSTLQSDPLVFIERDLGTTFPYQDFHGSTLSTEQVGQLVRVGFADLMDNLGPVPAELVDSIHIFELRFPSDAQQRRIITQGQQSRRDSGYQSWRALSKYRSGDFQIDIESDDIGILQSVRGFAFAPDSTQTVEVDVAHHRTVVRIMAPRPFGRGHGFIVTWRSANS